MEEKLTVVLASASPRRISLLRQTGLNFKIQPSSVDESSISYKTPRELALKTAYAKALDVAEDYPSALIIAADTVVSLEDKVYGKPTDNKNAREILRKLSGKTHSVITGIAVKEGGKSTAALDAVETKVKIKKLTEKEIADYVATGEPLDKAGAYAIQEKGGRFVEAIEGCYFNVVGLPLPRLIEMLRQFLPETNLILPESPKKWIVDRKNLWFFTLLVPLPCEVYWKEYAPDE